MQTRADTSTAPARPEPNLPLAAWQVQANKWLLKLIATHATKRPHPWGTPAQQADAARIAAAHKNTFAQELAGMSELPHPDIVREVWAQTVKTFEAEIRAYRAQSGT